MERIGQIPFLTNTPFHQTCYFLFLCIPPDICMGSFLFFPLIFFFFGLVSGSTSVEFIYPNFTASNLQFVDSAGAFLSSRNGTFKAAVSNPRPQQSNFYLCVIHVASNTIIWSANRDAPISNSGKMTLTVEGISIADVGGSLKWSTPALQSSVYALRLTEMGNLVLLDQFNNTLWESFQYPTDTVVIGQDLPAGTFLYSSVSDNDFSTGDYRLSITASDAILQWHGQTYWKLSMDTRAYTNSNFIVEYLAMNKTGLFLFGRNGSAVVIQVIFSPSDFRIAKLGSSGQFTVSSFSGSEWKQDFMGPIDGCRIPYICGRLGLCTAGAASTSPVCSCPSSFHGSSLNTSGCAPSDSSYSLPLGCSSTNQGIELNSSAVSYLRLGYSMDYFSNVFSQPILGVNLSVCQDLCTKNCSCLGVFYENSSGSCYLLENELGSIIFSSTDQNDLLGYIKALASATSPNSDGNSNSDQRRKFPVVALVLLPFTGFFLLVALGFLLCGRWRLSKRRGIELGHHRSFSSGDLDAFYIPGLPKRFDYEQLELATDNFKTQIGSGGFGSVYKGTLPDKTVVAVKKITNLGVQGKKEFCTEIAVIGNIHHANLVKLKGFCAQGRLRLLVYEYMNRGSLDRTLFGSGPVLEWQERVDIALGTARGLAYLHCGCEQKIIHCDIKPENILLHDQFQAKISDFGLSKLLSPEQSSLFTTMRGTRGYLAPEWLTNAAISEKTDVYSFGMVLLELVSGRKNCSLRSLSHSLNDSNSGGAISSSSSGSGLIYFPLFALEMHEQGRYLELVDPRLEGRVTGEEVEKLVRVALCCVHEDPALRPNMVAVVGMLEGGMLLGQPRLESLNFLRFYGRRFTEASMIEEATEQSGTELHAPANASSASSMSDSLPSTQHVLLGLCCSGAHFLLDLCSPSLYWRWLLVKNTFLKNERTLSRKVVEMVLSLALERTISKRRILSCYMCKDLIQIYWGHGIHGIESASDFYFGKHPSLLTLGESALLAGIIPAPELRSPFRDRSRGKIFQARVLKRMVDVGFLDVKTALSVLKQPLSYVNGPPSVDGILHLSSFTGEELRGSTTLTQGYTDSTLRSVWDWEAESRIWETCEEMERWAMKIRRRHGIRWSPMTKFW
ncbi:GPCR kinase [Trema orientale]|uniref:GPCR kinase n=1 Tax=Trema orientale TaxID=63057 RepID=A0A2P5E5Q8_TREOI|nr:GPCR kinase [Trema orientale]